VRRFHSYGPIDTRFHFGVERRALVEQYVTQLVGEPGEAGHFFTVWGPRQTGKTWLMRRAMDEVRARHGDRFTVGTFSMGSAAMNDDEPVDAFLRRVPHLFDRAFGHKIEAPATWQDWMDMFRAGGGLFDRPVILLIDEFDDLPRGVLDRLVRLFREMYLDRGVFLLHGLALVGVRAVLGIDSDRGSPFNVQRSLHVPGLTRDEVVEMFGQYQAESGQAVLPEVVLALYATTRGQPGLVGWFGELLTEKYNEDRGSPVTLADWDRVLMLAHRVEPNNTVLNLIKKAKGPYRHHVMGLFGRADVPFSFDQDWCSYLYTNGIIDFEEAATPTGERTSICRFSSPFVQRRLHAAFTDDLVPRLPILALDPLDTLSDVFTDQGIDAAALCGRYRAYLARLRAAGHDPFLGEERRSDLGLREAVGHFHLYAWLREAVGSMCAVSPEFPTGNGKVDLLLRTREHRAVIEVKSFRSAADLLLARRKAARYAKGQSLPSAALAVFVPVSDEDVLAALSGDEILDGVRVTTVAIGWA
jgi:hypothetical protein